MSTSESWEVSRHIVRCTSPVTVVTPQCKLVSGWRLRKQKSSLLCGFGAWKEWIPNGMKSKKVTSSTCYSTSYMRWTQNQKCFTVSEVPADWHELMITQHTMRPSTAHVNKQLDPHGLQLADLPPPLSDTLGLHPIACKLLIISHPMEDRMLSWTDIFNVVNTLPIWFHCCLSGVETSSQFDPDWHCTECQTDAAAAVAASVLMMFVCWACCPPAALMTWRPHSQKILREIQDSCHTLMVGHLKAMA